MVLPSSPYPSPPPPRLIPPPTTTQPPPPITAAPLTPFHPSHPLSPLIPSYLRSPCITASHHLSPPLTPLTPSPPLTPRCDEKCLVRSGLLQLLDRLCSALSCVERSPAHLAASPHPSHPLSPLSPPHPLSPPGVMRSAWCGLASSSCWTGCVVPSVVWSAARPTSHPLTPSHPQV